MGTNYYAVTKYCQHCKRGNPIHIGKSSVGWMFVFHGYPDPWDEVQIRSWAEWKYCLLNEADHIEDEYGKLVSFADFKKVVENRHNPSGLKIPANEIPHHHKDKYWLDPEGQSFCSLEFS